jgi:hypothetical protein
MARKIRDAKLESRTARLRLPVQKKPFTGPALARGIHLLYRRNKGNGTWIAKASNGHGGYWTKGFAVADDFEDADASHVLTFHEACDSAKALARGKADAHHGDKPMTVADAVAAYKRDLTSRGGHLGNATRVDGSTRRQTGWDAHGSNAVSRTWKYWTRCFAPWKRLSTKRFAA